MAIDVRVASLSGELCALRAYKWWTVRDLKEKIEAATGIHAREQRLISYLAELADDDEQLNAWHNALSSLTLLRRAPEQAEWLERVRLTQGEAFRQAPASIRADREVVLAAVQEDPSVVESMGDALWSDREVVLAALQHGRADGEAVRRMAPEFWSDYDVVLAAVQVAAGVLGRAAPELRADPDIALAAVQSDGDALQHVSADLRGDYDIVLAAVQSKGAALRYAADELRADADMVLEALESDGTAFWHAAPEVQVLPDVIFDAVRRIGAKDVLRFTAEEVRDVVQEILDNPNKSADMLVDAF